MIDLNNFWNNSIAAPDKINLFVIKYISIYFFLIFENFFEFVIYEFYTIFLWSCKKKKKSQEAEFQKFCFLLNKSVSTKYIY